MKTPRLIGRSFFQRLRALPTARGMKSVISALASRPKRLAGIDPLTRIVLTSLAALVLVTFIASTPAVRSQSGRFRNLLWPAAISRIFASGTAAPLSPRAPTVALSGLKYRTLQSGNWNDFNTWQVDSGSGFINAVAGQTPSSSDDTIEIQNGHLVTVTASVDADQLTL
jgi:hypothetical protein